MSVPEVTEQINVTHRSRKQQYAPQDFLLKRDGLFLNYICSVSFCVYVHTCGLTATRHFMGVMVTTTACDSYFSPFVVWVFRLGSMHLGRPSHLSSLGTQLCRVAQAALFPFLLGS